MIKRVRPKYSEAQLKQIYARPHDAKNWHDHLIRIAQTSEVVKWICLDDDVQVGADLSCGNASIAHSASGIDWHLGDFAAGYEYQGPIEETIHSIPNVDIFILSETLEHLDDPVAVLKAIREKTRYLVLSTPDDAGDDNNPEHYWSWDNQDIRQMLTETGFTPFVFNKLELTDYYYDFQIWGCR